jgi:hypothetical protein
MQLKALTNESGDNKGYLTTDRIHFGSATISTLPSSNTSSHLRMRSLAHFLLIQPSLRQYLLNLFQNWLVLGY